MRLAILSTEFPPGPGGIGTHAYQLAKRLCDLGWEPTVLSPQDYAGDGEIEQFNNSRRFPVVRLRSLRFKPTSALHRARIGSRTIRASRPDLLVASGARAVWITALLAGSHRLPWVAIGHGTEFLPTSHWQRAMTRWAFSRATAVVPVSQFTRDLMRRAGIRPASEQVIPNGADPDRFAVLPRSEVQPFRARIAPNAKHLLLTVGNVTERKGQDVIIRALPEILRRHPRTQYLMVGLPTRRAELTRIAEQLGVAEHAHFLGRLTPWDVVLAYNACDLFVMTSRTTTSGDCEGYGIAAVEAALCGKPAVVSRDSGLIEAIVDGRTGLAVPEGDWRATADAIADLLANPGRRAALGDAARRRALDEQTWEHRVRQYDVLFRQVVRMAGRPPARAGRPKEVTST